MPSVSRLSDFGAACFAQSSPRLLKLHLDLHRNGWKYRLYRSLLESGSSKHADLPCPLPHIAHGFSANSTQRTLAVGSVSTALPEVHLEPARVSFPSPSTTATISECHNESGLAPFLPTRASKRRYICALTVVWEHPMRHP